MHDEGWPEQAGFFDLGCSNSSHPKEKSFRRRKSKNLSSLSIAYMMHGAGDAVVYRYCIPTQAMLILCVGDHLVEIVIDWE